MRRTSRRAKPEVLAVRPAGCDHQVVTVKTRAGDKLVYRRTPCSDCPWRKDAVGVFPAEAFKHSASTAYDMAANAFACHQSGVERSAICAGFLLKGADHNLSVRLKRMQGAIKDDVHADGVELHDGYAAMAVANGVAADDPVLRGCRDNGYGA